MELNAKFIKYIENEASPEQSYGLMGLAVVSRFNGAEISHYIVKQNKNGGFFIESMSQKMNNQFYKSSVIDSNYLDQEIKDMIRKNVNAYYNKTTTAFEPVITTKQVHNYSNEEVPF